MSFKKSPVYFILCLILAAALAGCGGQSAAPTATVAPTVAEPTAVPAEPTTEEAEAPVAEATEEIAEQPVEEAEVPVAEESLETVEQPAEEVEAPVAEEPLETAEQPVEEAEAPVAEEPLETVEQPAEEAEVPMVEEPLETVEQSAEETETIAADRIAATVDGEPVSLETFIQAVTFNRYQYLNMYSQYAQMYSMYGLPLDSLDEQMVGILGEDGKERLGSEVIDQLTYDKVLEMEAKEAGLEITEDEVYGQLKTMFGYEDPEPEEEGLAGLDSFNVTLNATDTEDDKNNNFRSYAQTILDSAYGSAVSFDYLKNYAKNILTDNKLFEKDLEDRVFEAEMVSARHILVEDEDTAKEILAKLDAGEDWATLASEHSLDTSNKDNSGDLGWFGRGEMVAEFEEAAFGLEPGEISEPVQTSFGYHIIASDGKEVRPLSGSALQNAQNAAYDEWTMSLRAKHDIQSNPEVWMNAVPMIPAFVPSVTTAPAEEPAAEETVVEETIETEAPAEEPAAEEALVEETAESDVPAEEPAAEEPVAEETVETEALAEEPAAEEAVVEETAETEVPAEEPAMIEAVPIVETEAEVIESTEPEQAEETASEEVIVAMVDGKTPIYADDFVNMATYNRYQILATYNQYAQYYSMFGLPLDDVNAYYEDYLGEGGRQELGEATINMLTYLKMLEQEAEDMGIQISSKEVTTQMKQTFGYEEDDAQAESSLGLDSFNLLADEGFDEDNDIDFRAYMDMNLDMAFDGKITYDFFHDSIYHSMLENAVVEDILEGRIFEGEMVNARHILVEEEETAKEILSKLDAGEDWDALAAEYSLDTGNKDNGGNLGWFGRDVMVTEFEDAAFALEPGEISEPVKTSFGWHIIASDGKEMRPLEDEALESAQSAVYQEWYDDVVAKHQVESYPETWLPLVPMEPVFTPIVIDTENSDIPTFHILPDGEENSEEEEDELLSIVNTEQEEALTISNTEQENVAYTLNNDAEMERGETSGSEAEVQAESQSEQSSEQEKGDFSLSNTAENK